MYVYLLNLLIKVLAFKSMELAKLKTDCSWKFFWDVLKMIVILELNVTVIESKSEHNEHQTHRFDLVKNIPPFFLSDEMYHVSYVVIF